MSRRFSSSLPGASLMLVLVTAACVRSHLHETSARDAGQASDPAVAVDSGPVVAIEPYAPCSPTGTCGDSGLSPSHDGPGCTCLPDCNDNAPDCPLAPGSAAEPECRGFLCRLQCSKVGESDECPAGTACALDVNGAYCTTTPEGVAHTRTHGDGDPLIEPHEIYSVCETFAPDTCAVLETGSGYAQLNGENCTCSAYCFRDEDCPPGPPGSGKPACIGLDFAPISPGWCALRCTDDTECPQHLSCRTANISRYIPNGMQAFDFSVCRGGIYRHGDGDDKIEPGEAYGPTTAEGWCDPGLAISTAGGGSCVDDYCFTSEDCAPPPPGHGTPVCGWAGDCFLPCSSNDDCRPGTACDTVNGSLGPELLGCQ